MILNVNVTVECDKCGEEENYELIHLDDRELAGILESDDWTSGSSPLGKYMHCPNCSESKDE